MSTRSKDEKAASAIDDGRKRPPDPGLMIASVLSDPLPWHYGGVMINMDETLRSRQRGWPYKIYDEIERDCHAAAVLNKRKMALISKPWEIIPASESRLDKKAADLVKQQLDNLNFDWTCLKLLDATLKGFAVAEIIWEPDGSEVVAAKVLAKPQRRFMFNVRMKPQLLTLENPWPGIPLPERKFIVHRFGAKDDDNPYGLGLGYALFWPVFFKRQDISFWLMFAEKFATPTTVGKYPPGASRQDQDKLMQALSAINTDGNIVVPDNVLIELLDASRGRSTDTHEKLCRYLDEQISECVLGETLTTNLSGGGSLAATEVHEIVRMELVKADSDLLCETLNSTLVKWICEFNLPNANPPKFYRECSDPEDLKMRSDRDVNIYDMGFDPDESYINDTYGGKWTKRSPELQQQMKLKAPKTTPSSFAERAGRRRQRECPRCGSAYGEEEMDTPDAIAGPLSEAAGPAMDAMIEPVRKLIDGAKSMEEVRDGLLALYGEIDPRRLGAIMAQAMMLAEVHGRYDVQNGE